MKHLIVIMGVAASGKSTIASKLSEAEGWKYLEGDEFHPEANVEKMTGGTPLTNKDREAWIDAMAEAVREYETGTVILSCSALNDFVRTRLIEGCACSVHWVYLQVSRKELTRRMQARENHFMKETMLDSQLAAMKPPEYCLRINGDQSVETVLDDVKRALRGALSNPLPQ
ncbi:gluconokinase [Litorimonas sp.]|uniref:gluconokinase n=1 Tax=Litorimonas sp. TaxID=1892381 RepID=UPI003A83DBB9